MTADWVVRKVRLTADARKSPRGAYYRFHVSGINLSNGETPFSWQVSDLNNPRYDLSGADWEPEAMDLHLKNQPATYCPQEGE